MKHALIVGGSKGAGKVTAQLLSANGYTVSVISRNPPAEDVEEGYWAVDISDTQATIAAVADIFEKRGAFDCVAFFQRFRGSEDVLHGELEVSVRGTESLINALVDKLDLKNCSIVLVGSVNGDFISKKVSLGYHIAKAAIKQLVKYYAVSLGPRNIRVNGISPGTFVKSESAGFFQEQPELVARYCKIIPLARMGAANEVAEVVAFLCSEKSSFVTGQEITVDGGASLVLQEALISEL